MKVKKEKFQEVKLLCVKIDYPLNFDIHKNKLKLYSKAAMQLSNVNTLQKYTGKEEKITIVNSLVYSTFNYFPLFWHFCSRISSR